MYSYLREFIPKSVICFREGYSRDFFFQDLFAGIGIGIISLPLVMAFAIASGVSPERGLYTGIVAGFLIALLGGSRVQIGGPTGAYVVLVYGIVEQHGYDGLVIATLLSGLIIAGMGLAKLGKLLKYIPYPVIVGFTSGIACLLFSSQIKDFFGLRIDKMPVEFLDKWMLYFQTANTWHPWALFVTLFTLGIIILFRCFFPRIPAIVVAVFGATAMVAFFEIPVETIASKFGSIPRTLPSPSLPPFSWEKIVAVFPDVIPIAILGAVESLLSAVVADSMMGTRHRSNCELFAQGIANIGSAIFGGIPATGAIARTSANVRMHARTPVAGMTHAVTLFLLMLVFAPWAVMIPMPCLAAVLVFVAWSMSEMGHFAEILRGPRSEQILLITTFLLTILIDLSVATQVGVVLGALLFLRHMTHSTKIRPAKWTNNELENLPPEIALYEVDGPLFFGASDLLHEAYLNIDEVTQVFILHMDRSQMLDMTGIRELKQLQKRCQQRGILLLISGLRTNLHKSLKKNIEHSIASFATADEALHFAQKHISKHSPSSSLVEEHN